MYNPKECTLCPRRCRANRVDFSRRPVCGAGDKIRVAKAMLHFWEEPFISGKRGSGAIFFSGCSLKCTYCQNYDISHENKGADISEERLYEICRELVNKGAHNINLVSADHFVPYIAPVMKRVKSELSVPIVYNCSGYQSEEILSCLDGIADIYLVDMKYNSGESAKKYSLAENYPEVSKRALEAMVRQTGKCLFDADGMMIRGTVVRHLVLPGLSRESESIIDELCEKYRKDDILLSLMSQYTPNGREGAPTRRITGLEYKRVCDKVIEAGFDGCFQDRGSSVSTYTPDFDLEGVLED